MDPPEKLKAEPVRPKLKLGISTPVMMNSIAPEKSAIASPFSALALPVKDPRQRPGQRVSPTPSPMIDHTPPPARYIIKFAGGALRADCRHYCR